MPEKPERISLAQAARLCPNRPSPSTIWRWARRGLKARNGRRIRLHHIRCGGRVYTTSEALDEFFQALAAADCDHFDHSVFDASDGGKRVGRDRLIRLAERELDEVDSRTRRGR
ncbi:MAG: DUF1580 domain-containing protein [Phycisphaerales bacterium]